MTYLEDTQVNNWQGLNSNSQASNLIFIDTNLTDYQSLIPQNSNDAVYLIDSQQNGIEQITETLAKYSNLDSVSIFSHGDEGLLELGNTHLSASNLDNYQDNLTVWGNALSDNGDLLFYGCNVGAGNEGFDFVHQVAKITGADVAASDDLTGNANLGGDWILEVAIGIVETQTFTLTEYGGLLAISQYNRLNGITADFNGDGKADILRQEKRWADDDNSNTATLLIATGTGFTSYALAESLNIKGDTTNLLVGDFNGDGKSDLLRQEKGTADDDNSNTATLLISTGTAFTSYALPESFNIKGDLTNLLVGDFNGDGKSDVFVQEKENFVDDGVSQLLVSTGTWFNSTSVSIPSWITYATNSNNLYVGDFNGDGKSDLLTQQKGEHDNDNVNTARLLISTGSNFTSYLLSESLNLKGDITNIYVGDFNGDGKSDVLRQDKGWADDDNSGTANLLISTGTSFNSTALSEDFWLQGDKTNLYVGDFNGDGKSDIFRQEKSNWDNTNDWGTAVVLTSTGTNFTQTWLAPEFLLQGDLTNLFVGDFNGDNKFDLVRQEKSFADNDDSGTASLLISSGSNFTATALAESLNLKGDITNLITDNTTNNYLYHAAAGTQFNFTYGANVTTAQKKAMELAGELWSEILLDPVTINIHVDMSNKNDMPNGVIGAALPFFHLDETYSNVRSRLAQDASSTDDRTATNNLETGTTWSAGTDWLDSSKTVNINEVSLTRANAKSLGVIDGNNTTLDGVILLNDLVGTNVGWQYDYFSSSVGASNLDFTTVAAHELGHIMGFVSIIDGMTSTTPDNNMLINGATTFDLFRYQSNHAGTIVNRVLDQGYTAITFDRGLTRLEGVANGLNYGNDGTIIDSFQASHWYRTSSTQNWSIGIMDPYLNLNTRREIRTTDMRLMDAIGWDLRSTQEIYSHRNNYADDAATTASNKGSVNRNSEIDTEFKNWRWARGSTTSTLRQEGNIAQFLAQQGFFSIGSFRESFDFDAVQLSTTFLEDFLVTIERAESEELLENLDLDTLGAILEEHIEVNQNNEVTNYNELLASLTQWLSNYESGELTLADFQQFLDNQELVSSVVKDI